MKITPTQHERAEWKRLAKAAYAKGARNYGHVFTIAANHNGEMPLSVFDSLQAAYRQWLCFDATEPQGCPDISELNRTHKPSASIL